MASENSMDIVVRFDFQELRNAVDQCKRDSTNRYDLKDANVEIELNDDNIKITTQTEYQLDAVYTMLMEKMTKRGVSPKVLNKQKIEEIGGMRVRQEFKLIKALDAENAKTISKKIRDAFPKAKPSIQGDIVRVSSKSIDDLQGIMRLLQGDETIKLPLEFMNYR